VHPPQKNTAKLIFRDNYDHAFSTEDHSSMERILDHAQLCHPLIMKLLGQGASANGWSVQDLDARMELDASGFTRGADSKELQLRRIYQKMYSLWNIGREREQLLRLFSLFPYESYELPFLTHVLGGYSLGGRSADECLDSLYQLGWLEKRGGRYGMHPFIAECVQPDAVTEEELTPLYEAVFRTKIPDEKYRESGNRLFESEKTVRI
ncbi:MAG: hypothetical protein LUF30_12130, partial [Lachnospiraceae bacterium]|nr:hypothetical protein [Lachnospiraceae bacterium]